MTKSQIRCWVVENYRPGHKNPDRIYVTYPEDNYGYNLYSCLKCGHLYSASIAKMVYVGPPLLDKVKDESCEECGARMGENLALYPDTYLAGDQIVKFEKSKQIPDASSSIVKEFDELYGS